MADLTLPWKLKKSRFYHLIQEFVGTRTNMTTTNTDSVIAGLNETRKTSMVWKSLGTIVYSQLTAAVDGLAETVTLASIPAGSYVHDVVVYVRTQFTGAGVASCTLSVGDGSDANGFTIATDILGCGDATYVSTTEQDTDKGVYLYPTGGTPKSRAYGYFYAAATPITAEITPDGAAKLTELTAGSCTVYALYSTIVP